MDCQAEETKMTTVGEGQGSGPGLIDPEALPCPPANTTQPPSPAALTPPDRSPDEEGSRTQAQEERDTGSQPGSE